MVMNYIENAIDTEDYHIKVLLVTDRVLNALHTRLIKELSVIYKGLKDKI